MRRLSFTKGLSLGSRNRYSLVLFAIILTTVLSYADCFAQASPHGDINLDCTDCHTTGSWTELASPMKFDHSQTGFKLYGEHRNVACKECHAGLKFTNAPRDCFSCHQKNYDASATINHRIAGFGTDCIQCHAVDGMSWQSSFNHDLTQFPTRGAHDAVACLSCHVGNRYRGTPSECISCHLNEYNTAQNPNHIAAGFNTECAVCHRALTWQPAAFFPHPYFPIHAGDIHSPGVWKACTDCHVAQPNYSTFACINCHEHTESRMNSQHANVKGYVYQSSACYSCHPTGGG